MQIYKNIHVSILQKLSRDNPTPHVSQSLSRCDQPREQGFAVVIGNPVIKFWMISIQMWHCREEAEQQRNRMSEWELLTCQVLVCLSPSACEGLQSRSMWRRRCLYPLSPDWIGDEGFKFPNSSV